MRLVPISCHFPRLAGLRRRHIPKSRIPRWRQHDFSSLPYFASLGNEPSTACNRTEDASAVIEKAMLERRATSMPQVFQSFLLFFAFPESECLLHACEVLLVGILKALEVSVVVRDG